MKTDPLQEELNLISPNKIGLIDPPDTEFESQIHLLYTMLNTLEGEMVYNESFGMNWASVLPKNYSDSSLRNFEYEVIQLLNDKCKFYLSNFNIIKAEAQNTFDDLNEKSNLIVLTQWLYKNKFTFSSVTIIKWNDKFGTLLSDIKPWAEDQNNRSSPMSSQILSNMINLLNSYLKEI